MWRVSFLGVGCSATVIVRWRHATDLEEVGVLHNAGKLHILKVVRYLTNEYIKKEMIDEKKHCIYCSFLNDDR